MHLFASASIFFQAAGVCFPVGTETSPLKIRVVGLGGSWEEGVVFVEVLVWDRR